jgi:hypothetical protein
MAQAKSDTPEARLKALMAALRAQGVTDPAVLSAIEKTPRDLFTPDLFKERSWEDSALPIACGQTISQPFIVGLMTQALTWSRAAGCWRSAPARATRPPSSAASRASSTRSSAIGP